MRFDQELEPALPNDFGARFWLHVAASLVIWTFLFLLLRGA